MNDRSTFHRVAVPASLLAMLAVAAWWIWARDQERAPSTPERRGGHRAGAGAEVETGAAAQGRGTSSSPPRAYRLRSDQPAQARAFALLARPDQGCLFGSDARCRALQEDFAACDDGEPSACLRSAEAVGQTAPRDLVVAEVLLRRACELELEEACERLQTSDALVAGAGEDEASYRRVREQCDRGDAAACHAVIEAKQREGESRDRDVLDALRRMCELGFDRKSGCIALAHRSDPDDARWALERACDMGSSDGCYLLARHLLGDGASPSPVSDLDSALDAYARACELSSSHRACAEQDLAREAGGLPDP